MPKFKALTHGSLSTPYREVQEGEIVELTDVEAAHYAKSKWLRPLKEVMAMKPVPLMSHMRIVGGQSVSSEGQLPEYARPDPKLAVEQAQIGTENFNAQMTAIKANEAKQDAASAKGKGTGNQDPLA